MATPTLTTVIPNGYYAVHNPADPTAVTYWRMSAKGLNPWPARAKYGPVLMRADVPRELYKPARRPDLAAWVKDWYRTNRSAWEASIRALIEADLAGCARRFAEFTIRCCNCGRALTDENSKVLGLGSECRRGIEPGTLAALITPLIGQAHAGALGAEGRLEASHITQPEGVRS